MSPAVIAAIIAGSVSLFTLIVSVGAQVYGIHRTSRDTGLALEAQSKQLETTIAEQGKQLDKTLTEQHIRTLNERFATAAEQLGNDKPPTVQLAGVYAMAGLADDWADHCQACIDVLCGYLRMPYAQESGTEEKAGLSFMADREVRHTVIRVITAHLRDGATVSWQGRDFDFTGVVFDGGDFSGAVFSDGKVSFEDSVFSGGQVSFEEAVFAGGQVSFSRSKFSGGKVNFGRAGFSGSDVFFSSAQFSGSDVFFIGTTFSSGWVVFGSAAFSGGQVKFRNAKVSGGHVFFTSAKFSGTQVDFGRAKFSGGNVLFGSAEFSGSEVGFDNAEFSGGELDFSAVRDWSVPPQFPWTSTPPQGVMLPDANLSPEQMKHQATGCGGLAASGDGASADRC